MQIIVLGMHRSGTSLITRLINMLGAYFGPEGISVGYSPGNPKGYWERRDVLECNEKLMKLHQCSWADTARWPLPHRPLTLPPNLVHAMRMAVLNMDAHRPWVVKDPRLCLTLPYWRPLLEVPVGVIVYRNPLEIAQSLHMRDKIPIARGLALWECYAVGMLSNSAGMPCVYAAHEDFLREPVQATSRLCEALLKQGVQGLRQPQPREITAFVDAKLYRAKPTAPLRLSDYQQSLVAMLRGTEPPAKILTLSEASRKILQEPFGGPAA